MDSPSPPLADSLLSIDLHGCPEVALSHADGTDRWNGTDLDGLPWNARSLGALELHLALRNDTIRRRRMDRGQDPDGDLEPVTWFGPAQGRPISS